MIVLHDTASADLTHVEAMAQLDEGFCFGDYVLIEDQRGGRWVGQVTQPNRNISTVGERLDPTILHGLELMQEHEDVRAVDSVQVYDLTVLGEYDGQLLTPRTRPLPGARVAKMEADALLSVLALPDLIRDADGTTNVVGRMLNADDIPLCMRPDLFNYHVMVVGGTGSGKSNASANLVAQALRSGRCVVVHDAKPDYEYVGHPNGEASAPVQKAWTAFGRWGLQPAGARDIIRVGFNGQCDPDSVDAVVGFAASDFSPDMLAGLFFPYKNESNQLEEFASTAERLKQDRDAYAVNDIVKSVAARMRRDAPPQDQIHEATGKAVLRKVHRRRREFTWLDAVAQTALTLRGKGAGSQASGERKRVERLRVDRLVRAGRVIVVDYRRLDEAAYAVILSYFLNACTSYRRDARRGQPLVVELVDEAHRIFDNDSAHRDALERGFSKVMREGRSIGHGVVLSLQNASQIPPQVMNNLNSKVVMRQNGRSEAEAAAQTMGREFVQQAMRLGTGQALVSLFEARAVVLAHMAPSPYELMRTDNVEGARGTGGDGTMGLARPDGHPENTPQAATPHSQGTPAQGSAAHNTPSLGATGGVQGSFGLNE